MRSAFDAAGEVRRSELAHAVATSNAVDSESCCSFGDLPGCCEAAQLALGPRHVLVGA